MRKESLAGAQGPLAGLDQSGRHCKGRAGDWPRMLGIGEITSQDRGVRLGRHVGTAEGERQGAENGPGFLVLKHQGRMLARGSPGWTLRGLAFGVFGHVVWVEEDTAE